MPLWRNWQTHTTQNRTGNHMGSSPISGIFLKRVLVSCLTKEWTTFFIYQILFIKKGHIVA